jgi:rhodanese-related sulfurtransferase
MNANLNKWVIVAGLAVAMAFTASPLLAQDDNGPVDPTVEMAPPVQTISQADALKLLQSKATNFVFVDTAPPEAFAESHIPGAINFPWVAQIKPPIDLPRDKMLILYCPCTHDEDSTDMDKKLAEFGYYNTKVLDGGWYKWVALKYPVFGNPEGTPAPADSSPSSSSSAAKPTESASAAQPAATGAATAPAVESATLTSGRPVGAVTPSFRVIDVTGKYKGTDTCYVCEYGTAPTIIGFFKDTSDQTADLIVKMDRLVQDQSGKNLKGVAVLVMGPDSKAWLEKLAADKNIKIPLVYLANGTKDLGMRLYKINAQADNTILVNDNRQVVDNFVNVTPSDFNTVADASAKMLDSSKPAGQ